MGLILALCRMLGQPVLLDRAQQTWLCLCAVGCVTSARTVTSSLLKNHWDHKSQTSFQMTQEAEKYREGMLSQTWSDANSQRPGRCLCFIVNGLPVPWKSSQNDVFGCGLFLSESHMAHAGLDDRSSQG